MQSEAAFPKRSEMTFDLCDFNKSGLTLQFPVNHLGDKDCPPPRVADDEIGIRIRVPRLERGSSRNGQAHCHAETVCHRDRDPHAAVGTGTESDNDAPKLITIRLHDFFNRAENNGIVSALGREGGLVHEGAGGRIPHRKRGVPGGSFESEDHLFLTR